MTKIQKPKPYYDLEKRTYKFARNSRDFVKKYPEQFQILNM